MKNEDVVGAASTGNAPTTSEWATILLPKVWWLILEVLHHLKSFLVEDKDLFILQSNNGCWWPGGTWTQSINSWGTDQGHPRIWFGTKQAEWDYCPNATDFILKDANKMNKHQTTTKWQINRPVSQIPQCTCPISHNAPFRAETHTFLFWMVHCWICLKLTTFQHWLR